MQQTLLCMLLSFPTWTHSKSSALCFICHFITPSLSDHKILKQLTISTSANSVSHVGMLSHSTQTRRPSGAQNHIFIQISLNSTSAIQYILVSDIPHPISNTNSSDQEEKKTTNLSSNSVRMQCNRDKLISPQETEQTNK